MDIQKAIKNRLILYNFCVIELIIGRSFYVNVGAFYCITVCYTGTDIQDIILTTHEEYHPRQFTTVEYNCLRTLYLHT